MTFVTLTRPRSGDFATLSREVRRAGLLERRRVYYMVKMVLNLAVFAAAWVVFVAIGDSWWQLLMAVFFVFMFTQVAFIGHDAGHKQIFRTRCGNDVVGYLHGGLVGLSYDWWMAKHQAALFFPLLLAEGLNLHWSSIRHVWRGDGHGEGRAPGLVGCLHGMLLRAQPQGHAHSAAGHWLDYLRKQVLTSRNVYGRRWVDLVLGGLNYQIEHHLFPSMPRPNLRRGRALVQSFCQSHGIDYVQCGLLRSYAHVLHHLRAIGTQLRHERGRDDTT